MIEYYSAIKKDWDNAICSNLDRPKEIIMFSEISQTKKNTT